MNTDSSDASDQSTLDIPLENTGGGLDAIADSLVAEMPEPSQHAIDAAEATKTEEAEKTDSYSHLKHKDGTTFNPDIHQTDLNGEPVTNAGGFLVKKRGRKKGNVSTSSVVAAGTTARQGKQEPDQTELANTAAALESGRAAANLVMAVGIVLGGEEWRPTKDEKLGLDEEAQLTAAFGQYFVATGTTDIPPGWALTITLCSYALPRFTMPKTQNRAKSIGQKLKAWWINRKADKAIKNDKKES